MTCFGFGVMRFKLRLKWKYPSNRCCMFLGCTYYLLLCDVERAPKSSYTVKALLSPWGAYLVSDLPEEGLIERELIREGGGLININQHTILRLKCINSTQFLSETMPKLACKVL